MNPIASPVASACTMNGQTVSCDQLVSDGGLYFGIALLFFGLMMTVGLALFIFQILMIIHAAQKDIQDRAMWIVVMVLTGGIGAIIYYFAVKRPFDREQAKSRTAATRKRAVRRK